MVVNEGYFLSGFFTHLSVLRTYSEHLLFD